jgi:hypothetical protein
MDGMRRVCGTIVLAAALLSLAACGGGGGGAGAGPGASLTGTWSGSWAKTTLPADDSGTIDSVTIVSDSPPTGTLNFATDDGICIDDGTVDVTGDLNGSSLSLTLTGTNASSVVLVTATLANPIQGTYIVDDSGDSIGCSPGWEGTITLNKSS